MVVVGRIPWGRLFKDLKYVMILVIIYNAAIIYFDFFERLFHFSVPLSLITIPGTVISMLLAFRTNAAYERWWEGRMIWGEIVNDSRTLTRQVISFTNYFENKDQHVRQLVKSIAYRQMAWCYCLCKVLRGHSPEQDLLAFVSEREAESLKRYANIPNQLLQNSALELKKIEESNNIDRYQYMQVDSTIRRLTDSMGKCERIKNTVFPVLYSRFLDLLIYFLIFGLPFGLIDYSINIFLPVGISLSFAFLAVDRIAFYLQDPFEGYASDVPMYALSRTIEVNIRQQLGENQTPELLKPIDGVLM